MSKIVTQDGEEKGEYIMDINNTTGVITFFQGGREVQNLKTVINTYSRTITFKK